MVLRPPDKVRPTEGLVIFGVSYVASVLVAGVLAGRMPIKLVASLSTASLLATGVILLSAIRFPPFQLLGSWKISPGLMVLTVAASLTIIPLSMVVEGVVLRRFGIPEDVIRALLEILRARDLGELMLVWSVAGLGAAVGEELIFRGILQRSLYGSVKGWLAVVIAGIIFGVLHNPWRMASASLLGIYMGFLYLWTDCLVFPIVAHLTINSFVVISLYISEHSGSVEVPKWIGEPAFEATLPPWYLVAFSTALFVVLSWLIAGYRNQSKNCSPS